MKVWLADEDFESFADNKTFATGDTISAIVSEFGFALNGGAAAVIVEETIDSNVTKVLKLIPSTTQGGGGNAGITYNTASNTENAVNTDNKKVFITFKAKREPGPAAACVPYVYYSNSSNSASVTNQLNNGGKFVYYNGSTSDSNTAAVVGEWHDLGIVINYAAGDPSSTFTVDGVKVTASASFRQSGSGFGRVRFHIDGNATPAPIYLDDIKIWYE